MSHTPGPWVVGNTDPLMFGRPQGNGTEPLGFVYGPSLADKSAHGRECLANARLAAAAPELLEALQDAQRQTRHPDYDWPLWLSQAVSAAIAKATGEQS